MKVVTVRQPFASLIAVGAKTLLDQARPTGYRGRLLIRAAMGHSRRDKHDNVEALPGPLGVVVASCELLDCVPITRKNAGEPDPGDGRYVIPYADGVLGLVTPPVEQADFSITDQLPFGDFTPGRWVWLLDDVRPTTERCPRCWALADKPWYPTMSVCDTCHETGGCSPVRMRGGPGLRTPEWEAT